LPSPQTEASKPSNVNAELKETKLLLEKEREAHTKTKQKLANAVAHIRLMNTKIDLLATDSQSYAVMLDGSNADIDSAQKNAQPPEPAKPLRGRGKAKKEDAPAAEQKPVPAPPGPEVG